MYSKKMWKDKRYHSVDSYIEDKYGYKMYKLALNGNMTCPNRDGKVGNRGCIFCSQGGSGDFAASANLTITDQIEEARVLISSKIKKAYDTGDDSYNISDTENSIISITEKPQYIAYFQAYTNTYAPVDYLRRIFYEAFNDPCIAILSIATRPDCLDDDVLKLLKEHLLNVNPSGL